MRVDQIKNGFEHVSDRSLLRANNIIHSDEGFQKSFIGISNPYMDLIPDHVYIHKLGKVAKKSIRDAVSMRWATSVNTGIVLK